jgi:hypothetical protein
VHFFVLSESRAFFVTALTFFRAVRRSGARAIFAAISFIRFGDAIAIANDAFAVFVGAVLLRHNISPPLDRFSG